MKTRIFIAIIMVLCLSIPANAISKRDDINQKFCALLITFNMNWNAGPVASGRYLVPQDCYTIESVSTSSWINYNVGDGYIDFNVFRTDWESFRKPGNVACRIYFTDGTSHLFYFVFEGGITWIPDPGPTPAQ